MMPPPIQGFARPAFLGTAVLLLTLTVAMAAPMQSHVLAVAVSISVLLLLGVLHWALTRSEQRAAACEAQAEASLLELQKLKSQHESSSNDLALLGRFGNLLIGCTDIAETLQISEQMLSQLLPDCAGTIYPLIDGEGLAEATHLWGYHLLTTEPQASSEQCRCMQSRKVHLGLSNSPDDLCPHVLPLPPESRAQASACIPLVAQGESMGWMYLSADGQGPFPKLQIAIAAADQLALALANMKLRHSLRDLSVRDPLTGLFNRRYLSESLGREISRAKRRSLTLTVLAFDLDHFKNLNDNYGHSAGDAILVAFSRVLQSNSRSEDIACRQGGEEFLLIMPEMDLSVGLRRAGDLLRLVASMDVLHEGQLLPKVTASIGLAIYPTHGSSAAQLLAQADQALYQAKEQGRNRVVVATEA